MAILQHVLPQDVDDHWPRVRKGLERIVARHSPDWMPEHIYVALREDRARLSLVEDNGFLIWERYPGTNGRGMLFLVACEGSDMMRNYDAAMAEVDDLARRLNCKRIRHISPRKGWSAKHWRSVGYVYEREV